MRHPRGTRPARSEHERLYWSTTIPPGGRSNDLDEARVRGRRAGNGSRRVRRQRLNQADMANEGPGDEPGPFVQCASSSLARRLVVESRSGIAAARTVSTLATTPAAARNRLWRWAASGGDGVFSTPPPTSPGASPPPPSSGPPAFAPRPSPPL